MDEWEDSLAGHSLENLRLTSWDWMGILKVKSITLNFIYLHRLIKPWNSLQTSTYSSGYQNLAKKSWLCLFLRTSQLNIEDSFLRIFPNLISTLSPQEKKPRMVQCYGVFVLGVVWSLARGGSQVSSDVAEILCFNHWDSHTGANHMRVSTAHAIWCGVRKKER